ncbi:MAG: ATP citrate lyase citrate-binding domain-containing protein [bacterium]
MAQRKICEYDVKQLLASKWGRYFEEITFDHKIVRDSDLDDASIIDRESWLKTEGLVVKPDMLFGGRGKLGLVHLKQQNGKTVDLPAATEWIKAQKKKEVSLKNGISGQLTRFIIEPFIAHEASDEYYICIKAGHDNDLLYVSTKGGVDVEENWDHVQVLHIPVLYEKKQVVTLITEFFDQKIQHQGFASFATGLFQFFRDYHFTQLEINPFVLTESTVYCLDMVAEVDDSAAFLMEKEWQDIPYYADFGCAKKTEAERFIAQLDAKTGASLKLTLLNPDAQVWTMIAGGGASVVYTDTIAELFSAKEIANYGEYSGNPSTEETFLYAKTIFDLMTQKPLASGEDKILLIGGAIANFTDVAKTFEGIIQAFELYADKFKEIGVKIYVRRAGPNYERALKNIRMAAKRLGLSIDVYGPETHMTDIIDMAYSDIKA